MSQSAQAAPTDGKLAAATTRARQLAAAGDLAAAYAHLHQALAAAPAHPEAELADAAVVYAYTLTGTGHPDAALAWAGWAHTTIRRLHGEHDWRTLHATHLVAVVCQRTGDHTRAVAVWQHLVDILTIHDGLDSTRTLAARADLAVTLHTAGACDQAHTELAQAWATRRASHGDRDPLAVKMLTRLARMYRDCANPDQADTCHTLAHHFDRDSVDRVAVAARGPADPDHHAVCTHNQPAPQPDPAAAWPPDITAEPWHPRNR